MIYEDSISRALCPLPDLCDSLNSSHLFSSANLHQDELRRGRCQERNHDGSRGVSVPDRRVNGLPGFLRIQNIVS